MSLRTGRRETLSFSDCALPPGKWAGSSEFVVQHCPVCSARDRMYLSIAKGMGFCFKCETRVLGSRGIMHFWPELRGVAATPVPEFSNPTSVKLANPLVYGVQAWEVEVPRNFLITRFVREPVARQLPIYWVPQEGSLEVMVDPLSPEFRPLPWMRRLWDDDAKWRPAVAGTRSSAYAFGLRHLVKGIHTLILTEGIFDILAGGMLGFAAALLGTRAGDCWPFWCRKNGITRVVIWLDADAKGKKGSRELLQKFRAYGIKDVLELRTDKDPKHYVGVGLRVVADFLKEGIQA